MFKKLRNKFLIINMTIISVIKNKFEAIEMAGGDTKKTLMLSTFAIILNENGEIEYIESPFDMPKDTYLEALELGLAKKDYSVIKLDNTDWMVCTFQYFDKSQVVLKGENTVKASSIYRIVFLDVTDSNRTLRFLLAILILVGVIMLFVIAAISLFFANRAIKPIETAWEKQERFITDASHELKTPLTIIDSNYDVLLANREETIDSQMKWLERIKSGSDRMSMLINSLLTLAKAGNDVVKLHAETFHMGSIVKETLRSMEAAVNEKNISVNTSIDSDVTANSDADMASQVIAILLDNAVKYTNNGGWIELSLIKAKHEIIFTVKNSGKGIASEDIPKLFDRFYRADKSRKFSDGSYGLGLSIAKTISDRLGGTLTAESVENESATFSFIIKA